MCATLKKGRDSARDFPRFPGSSPHCYQSELLGFVTGNRSFLKFVLALLYSLQTGSVPKHVCFLRNGGADALSPHPAVAGDSRALEKKNTLYQLVYIYIYIYVHIHTYTYIYIILIIISSILLLLL